jgi:hypothetical protein
MRGIALAEMTVTQLVERFAALGVGQFDAELHGDYRKKSKLLLQMRDVTEELKSRPGDQRSALLPLFEHPNIQVRLMAARLTLALAPVAARQILQNIYDSKKYPEAGDAGMCLSNLDQGIFKPA